jgi:pimeloyl-ACP methyl ester carboxylesterase
MVVVVAGVNSGNLVPLDHDRPDGKSLTVFAREIADPDGRDRPLLVFFEGGPGFEAGRPTGPPPEPRWLARALGDYRVLMLDQRGTGRSTPVGALAGLTPAQQAAYLSHFRADSIVQDAELIRQELGVAQWSVLGQSFGGFCVMAYLSRSSEGLREAFVTGGLPPLGRHTDEVYRRTYPRVLERNRRYYDRYPEDRARVREVHRLIEDEGLTLPSGDRLTSRRFQQLGLLLGMSRRREAPLPPRAGAGLAGVPARRRGGAPVRPQPDLLRSPRILLRGRLLDALVGRAAASSGVRRSGAVHGRARLLLDAGGLRGTRAAA